MIAALPYSAEIVVKIVRSSRTAQGSEASRLVGNFAIFNTDNTIFSLTSIQGLMLQQGEGLDQPDQGLSPLPWPLHFNQGTEASRVVGEFCTFLAEKNMDNTIFSLTSGPHATAGGSTARINRIRDWALPQPLALSF